MKHLARRTGTAVAATALAMSMAPALTANAAAADTVYRGCKQRGPLYICYSYVDRGRGHYDFRVNVRSSRHSGRPLAHWSGWIDFDKKNWYDAKIWATDDFADGTGTRHQLLYHYSDGTEHGTRVWKNTKGKGHTVSNVAHVRGWGRTINYMIFKVGLGNTERYGAFVVFNPYR
jgi:hypothetical protein